MYSDGRMSGGRGDLHPATPPAFDIVVLAASAGAHGACRRILSSLPGYFAAPAVINRHRDRSGRPDMFTAALDRISALDVTQARHLQRLRPGTVSIPPGGRHATVAGDGRLRLAEGGAAADRGADALFESAARHYGRRALAVVLTGRLHDASAGVRAIKRAGGRVLVQDPAEAQAPGMPMAAIATGCVDLVLPLEVLTPALVTLVMAPGAAELFQVPLPAWASMTPPL